MPAVQTSVGLWRAIAMLRLIVPPPPLRAVSCSLLQFRSTVGVSSLSQRERSSQRERTDVLVTPALDPSRTRQQQQQLPSSEQQRQPQRPLWRHVYRRARLCAA
jgi:hypothetical protein